MIINVFATTPKGGGSAGQTGRDIAEAVSRVSRDSNDRPDAKKRNGKKSRGLPRDNGSEQMRLF